MSSISPRPSFDLPVLLAEPAQLAHPGGGRADLCLRRMSVHTQRTYLRCVRDFAAYHRRSPAELGESEIRAYLTHLVEERHVAPATQGVYSAALRFLYA